MTFLGGTGFGVEEGSRRGISLDLWVRRRSEDLRKLPGRVQVSEESPSRSERTLECRRVGEEDEIGQRKERCSQLTVFS